MFQIWASVKVNTPTHHRFGQAGAVFALNPAKPDQIGIRFDSDLVVESVAVADLIAL